MIIKCILWKKTFNWKAINRIKADTSNHDSCVYITFSEERNQKLRTLDLKYCTRKGNFLFFGHEPWKETLIKDPFAMCPGLTDWVCRGELRVASVVPRGRRPEHRK